LLEQRLRDQGYGYRVVNASVSGETSGGGLQRLPRALELHQPAVVIVELGANDGLRGLSVPLTTDNLTKIVAGAKQARAQVVLIGMRLPGRDSVWVSLALDFRRPLYVDQAAELEATVSSVSESTGMVELVLVLRLAGKVLAKGRVEVVVGQ